jgi:hypothetical protein
MARMTREPTPISSWMLVIAGGAVFAFVTLGGFSDGGNLSSVALLFGFLGIALLAVGLVRR